MTKKKNNVESAFAVNGFGFAGRGQNTGIAFVSLKDWAIVRAKVNKVEAITMRATRAFSQIKDAMVFALMTGPQSWNWVLQPASTLS
ncbi:efflux RND transporter permease subunit [Escherichia coli]